MLLASRQYLVHAGFSLDNVVKRFCLDKAVGNAWRWGRQGWEVTQKVGKKKFVKEVKLWAVPWTSRLFESSCLVWILQSLLECLLLEWKRKKFLVCCWIPHQLLRGLPASFSGLLFSQPVAMTFPEPRPLLTFYSSLWTLSTLLTCAWTSLTALMPSGSCPTLPAPPTVPYSAAVFITTLLLINQDLTCLFNLNSRSFSDSKIIEG